MKLNKAPTGLCSLDVWFWIRIICLSITVSVVFPAYAVIDNLVKTGKTTEARNFIRRNGAAASDNMLWQQQCFQIYLPFIALENIFFFISPRHVQNGTEPQTAQCVFDDSPTGILTCPIPPAVSTWLNTETCFCPTTPGSLRSDNTVIKSVYSCQNEKLILYLNTAQASRRNNAYLFSSVPQTQLELPP